LSSDLDRINKEFPEYLAMINEVFEERSKIGRGESNQKSDGIKLAPGKSYITFE
jgi:hypothetical protein